jgi:hypothetical protein
MPGTTINGGGSPTAFHATVGVRRRVLDSSRRNTSRCSAPATVIESLTSTSISTPASSAFRIQHELMLDIAGRRPTLANISNRTRASLRILVD